LVELLEGDGEWGCVEVGLDCMIKLRLQVLL
jgi:hypothetical protein